VKEQFEETLLHDLEEKFGRNESRKFVDGVHKFKMGFQLRTNL
jgi:hypothetical protein